MHLQSACQLVLIYVNSVAPEVAGACPRWRLPLARRASSIGVMDWAMADINRVPVWTDRRRNIKGESASDEAHVHSQWERPSWRCRFGVESVRASGVVLKADTRAKAVDQGACVSASPTAKAALQSN